MLITEQSLVETLDGRAGDPRRGCRLFIPHQAVFIPNQLLFSPRSVCSHPAGRSPGEAGHPAAGVKGITVEWSSNRVSPRVPVSAHVADRHHRRYARARTSPAQPSMARCRRLHRHSGAALPAPTGPGGWHRQHTDRGGLTHTRGDRRARLRHVPPMPEPSPTDWAAPDSLAAVLTPGQAVAVLPVVKSWENMLHRQS